MWGLAGSLAWPLTALGQQQERMRRVGALSNFAESDPEFTQSRRRGRLDRACHGGGLVFALEFPAWRGDVFPTDVGDRLRTAITHNKL